MSPALQYELIAAGSFLGFAGIMIVIGTWRMRVEQRKKGTQGGSGGQG